MVRAYLYDYFEEPIKTAYEMPITYFHRLSRIAYGNSLVYGMLYFIIEITIYTISA